MDFFARREATQARSRLFLFAFVITAMGALFVLYLVVTGCIAVAIGSLKFIAVAAEVRDVGDFSQYLPAALYGSPPDIFSFRPVFIVTSFIALFLALVSSLKALRIKIGGGAYAAKSLGWRALTEPVNIQERRLVNVVAEMAIASGLPRPRIFILPEEKSINAVTAGRDHEDAVIVVTQGALDLLDRDELQGVIAHEFAHILNDDSSLSLSMSGWLAGLLLFYGLGYAFLEASISLLKTQMSSSFLFRRSRSPGGLMAIPLFLAGFLLLVGGWLGKIAAEIFQAAFSRQREYLADAFAAGFTRNPFGLAGALKKIARLPQQGHLNSGRSMAMKSFFIVSPARSRGLMRSHPPLKKRILALDPAWDGQSLVSRSDEAPGREAWAAALKSAAATLRDGPSANSSLAMVWAAGLSPSREESRPAGPALARQLLEDLPDEIRRAVEAPDGATALIASLFFHDEAEPAARQHEIIQRILGPETERRAGDFKLWIRDALRLPLLSLAAPALRELSGADKLRLFQTVREMAAVDGRTDFFEVAAFQILRGHLGLPSAPDREEPGPEAVEEAAIILVSIMAHVGSGDTLAADRAFAFAMGQFTNKPFRLASRSSANSKELARALEILASAPEAERRRLVAAMTAAALSDQVVTTAEYELLRAAAAALDVPLPLVN